MFSIVNKPLLKKVNFRTIRYIIISKSSYKIYRTSRVLIGVIEIILKFQFYSTFCSDLLAHTVVPSMTIIRMAGGGLFAGLNLTIIRIFIVSRAFWNK